MNHLNIIKKKIEEQYDIRLDKTIRKRNYVEARSIYFKIAKDNLNITFDKLGKSVNKNHATVIHSIKNLQDLMSWDNNLKNNYNKILSDLDLQEESFNHLSNYELKLLIKSLIKENKSLKLHLQNERFAL